MSFAINVLPGTYPGCGWGGVGGGRHLYHLSVSMCGPKGCDFRDPKETVIGPRVGHRSVLV